MLLEPWAGVGGGEGRATYKHSQGPGRRSALIMHSPVDIDGWPLWRQCFGPDGPQLWWNTAVLRVLCFNGFFQEKWLRYFYNWVQGEKKIHREMNMYCSHQTICNHLVWSTSCSWLRNWSQSLNLWSVRDVGVCHPVEAQLNWINTKDFQKIQFPCAFCKYVQVSKCSWGDPHLSAPWKDMSLFPTKWQSQCPGWDTTAYSISSSSVGLGRNVIKDILSI